MSVRRGLLLPVLFHLILIPVSSQSFEELATRLETVDPDAPGSGDILLETLRRAPDVETARRYYSEYADLLSNPRQEVAGFRRLGTLEELVGNYQGALDAFEALLELEPDDDRIRLRAAAAALETGDYRRARGHAQFVIDSARNREAQREAGLYLALSHFFRGEREAGLSLFRSLTRGNSRRTVESRTLLYALLAARFWDERSYAAELEGKLEALYQGSLDTLAVKGEGAITLAPRPSLILPEGGFGRMGDLLPELVEVPLSEAPLPEAPGNRGSDSDDSEDSEAPGAEEREEAEEALVVGIQTGSFSDRENAVVMREEIRESGLGAEVRSVDIDGQTFYRVVVPTEEPIPAEDVQTLVVRLKELGVEGFLLFEE